MKCVACGCRNGSSCGAYPKLVVSDKTDWSGFCRLSVDKGVSLYTNEVRLACPQTNFGGGAVFESSEQKVADNQKIIIKKVQGQKKKGA